MQTIVDTIMGASNLLLWIRWSAPMNCNIVMSVIVFSIKMSSSLLLWPHNGESLHIDCYWWTPCHVIQAIWWALTKHHESTMKVEKRRRPLFKSFESQCFFADVENRCRSDPLIPFFTTLEIHQFELRLSNFTASIMYNLQLPDQICMHWTPNAHHRFINLKFVKAQFFVEWLILHQSCVRTWTIMGSIGGARSWKHIQILSKTSAKILKLQGHD